MPNRVRLSEWGSVSPKPGSSPGQIIAPKNAERTVIDAFVYSANVFEEMSDISVEKVHEANGELCPNLGDGLRAQAAALG